MMIYVHVPFCRSFCTYCDFYSEAVPRCRRSEDALRQEGLFERYSRALEAEVRAREDEFRSVCAAGGVNTLYIGGGTPSVLPLDVYRRLLDALTAAGVNPAFEEFTFEVNPEDVVEKGADYVGGLLDLGVSRVSMGVQSFDDGILKFMNRRHSSDDAVKAYHILESAGFENISIDLIFGLPQLSDDLWRGTLDRALDISSRGMMPRHISSYQLSVEPGSMLARLLEKGRWQEASEDRCAHQYGMLCEALGKAGYNHYEISNFALPGYEAVHNSAYWRHVPYIGLGPGAHSCLTGASRRGVPMATSQPCWAPHPARGCENAASTPPESMLQAGGTSAAGGVVRQWNRDSLEDYLKVGETGEFEMVREKEVLDGGQIVMEKVMLGLRTSSGLPESMLRTCCGEGSVDRALSSGDLVRIPGDLVRIPECRFFVSDGIISGLVG